MRKLYEGTIVGDWVVVLEFYICDFHIGWISKFRS